MVELRLSFKTLVYDFLEALNRYFSQNYPHIRKCIYFFDGAPQHFKNVKHFANVFHHESDFHRSAQWHFHATVHVKGPCDGASEKKAFSLPNILVQYKCSADYARAEKFLESRLEKCKTIRGTQLFHCVKLNGDFKFKMKVFSACDGFEILCFENPLLRKYLTIHSQILQVTRQTFCLPSKRDEMKAWCFPFWNKKQKEQNLYMCAHWFYHTLPPWRSLISEKERDFNWNRGGVSTWAERNINSSEVAMIYIIWHAFKLIPKKNKLTFFLCSLLPTCLLIYKYSSFSWIVFTSDCFAWTFLKHHSDPVLFTLSNICNWFLFLLKFSSFMRSHTSDPHTYILALLDFLCGV